MTANLAGRAGKHRFISGYNAWKRLQEIKLTARLKEGGDVIDRWERLQSLRVPGQLA